MLEHFLVDLRLMVLALGEGEFKDQGGGRGPGRGGEIPWKGGEVPPIGMDRSGSSGCWGARFTQQRIVYVRIHSLETARSCGSEFRICKHNTRPTPNKRVNGGVWRGLEHWPCILTVGEGKE